MRVQQCRSDRGWASVELAIITPALLFLVSLLITLLGVAAQRVNFTAALHEAALGAMHLESEPQLTKRAATKLGGFSDVGVLVVPQGDQVQVRLTAEIALPAPLSAITLHWSDFVTLTAGW